MKNLILLIALSIGFFSCEQKDCCYEPEQPQLIFKLKFDPTQERLDGLGNVALLPDTHGAQSPNFNTMSAHYIELTSNNFTMPGQGVQIFKGSTTASHGQVTVGGNNLDPIDFSKAIVKEEGEIFYSIPLKDVANGTYPYVRVSVTYQNFDITYKAQGFNGLTGTVASFVGYGQHLDNVILKNKSIAVNDTKPQGFWAVEDHITGTIIDGQAPIGATTVPNPLAGTSAIAEGSCLVTGVFDTPFTITGNETNDITIDLSFSINNSFEWIDVDKDNIYEPEAGDQVIDMGLRGLKPIVSK